MKLQSNRGRLALAKPLYGQVREMLLDRIRNGEWNTGDTLPNEFVLASQCGVSVGTIRRAVEGLEESGLVVRKQGRGTYVTGFATRAIEQKFCPLQSTEGERLPLDYELLGVSRRRAMPADREALGEMEGSDVLEVRQLILSDGRHVGVEVSLLPASLFPHLEKQLTTGQNLYAVFSSYGVLVTRADETIGLTHASAQISELLGVEAGAPLLQVKRRTSAHDGRPVERRESVFRSAEIRYGATIS